MRRALSLALLGALVMTGCPATTPVTTQSTGVKALPADAGSIRGFVYGAGGSYQPIPGVTVQAGRFTTTTGNPKESELVTEEVDDGRTITVEHTYGGSYDRVLVERRPRAYRDPNCSADDPFDCRYVYLRAGEFLFEGVPAGPQNVKPLVCDLSSPEKVVQVVAGAEQDDVHLQVDLPIMVTLESHDAPRVAEWKATAPDTAVKIVAAPGGGYQLQPSDIVVTLRSPPGSGGVTIVGTEIEYKWTVEQGSKVIRRSSGRRDVPRLEVPAGAGICWGPSTDMRVPLGSTALDGALAGTETVSQVEAAITFIDESGYPILSKNLESLRVPVTLSR